MHFYYFPLPPLWRCCCCYCCYLCGLPNRMTLGFKWNWMLFSVHLKLRDNALSFCKMTSHRTQSFIHSLFFAFIVETRVPTSWGRVPRALLFGSLGCLVTQTEMKCDGVLEWWYACYPCLRKPIAKTFLHAAIKVVNFFPFGILYSFTNSSFQ